MCGYFCNGFIDFMLKGKSLLDYTNLFFPNYYQKNGKICAITAGIEKYKLIFKKKKKKHDKIISLAKSKLNKIEVLISKFLIDLNISHDEFVSINNVLKVYEEMKKEIKNLKT